MSGLTDQPLLGGNVQHAIRRNRIRGMSTPDEIDRCVPDMLHGKVHFERVVCQTQFFMGANWTDGSACGQPYIGRLWRFLRPSVSSEARRDWDKPRHCVSMSRRSENRHPIRHTSNCRNSLQPGMRCGSIRGLCHRKFCRCRSVDEIEYLRAKLRQNRDLQQLIAALNLLDRRTKTA